MAILDPRQAGVLYRGSDLAPTPTPGWADALQQVGIGLLANHGQLGPGIAQGMQQHLLNRQRAAMLQREDAIRQHEWDYRAGRDQVGDARDQRNFDFQKSTDERDFGYKQTRDVVGDEQWSKSFGLQRDNTLADNRRADAQLAMSREAHSLDAEGARIENLMRSKRLELLNQTGVDPATGAVNAGKFQYVELQDNQGRPVTMRQNDRTGAIDYVLPDGTISTKAPDGVRTNSVGNSWMSPKETPYKEVQEAGYRAEQLLPHIRYGLDTMEKNPGLYQGTGGEAVQAWRNLASNWDPEAAKNAADASTLQSIYINGVLDYVNRTKGAVSDMEMSEFKSASAGLGKTPEANKRILQMSERMLTRASQYADFMAARAPVVGWGLAREEWSKGPGSKPVFGDLPGAGSAAGKTYGGKLTSGDPEMDALLGLQ